MSENDILEKATEELEDVAEPEDAGEEPQGRGGSEERIEQLEKDNALLRQQLLRLKADFENFRRRNKSQLEKITLEANEKVLQDLLPVLDNFERALNVQWECESEPHPFFQGMQMVYKSLLAALIGHGLEVIKAEGQPFDPRYHDAVSMAGGGEGSLIVTEEIQTGYLLNGKVIRHTKVLVGQNEEEDECQK